VHCVSEGSFTHDVITEGEGGFQMMTEGGGGLANDDRKIDDVICE
jgi:hypothetical protein